MSTTKKSSRGAVSTAKRRRARVESGPITLSTGIEARLLPVSISLINEAQAAIPDPEVPMWHNESKDTYEPNPNHPQYKRDLEQVEADRNVAAIDAMVMFGVELVDGMPEDDGWLKKLKLRQRVGLSTVDLGDFDLKDEIDLEYLYKKYVAVATPDVAKLMKASGVSEEDIAEAARSFRDNA
jgi:hypothetical protein